MPVSRSTLIRLRVIDQCLCNRYRRWTLQDLIDKCAAALNDMEGRRDGISRRTIQADLALMRSDRLGMNAPIVVVDKKYYTYSDPSYSTSRLPLSEDDMAALNGAMDILRHFQMFPALAPAAGVISKLEEHIAVEVKKEAPAIDLEHNDQLKGLELLPTLYRAVRSQLPLEVTYQSFRARQASLLHVSPYLLKEFHNRWFVLCSKIGQLDKIVILAVDRIESLRVEEDGDNFEENPHFDKEHFFDDVFGVTKDLNDQPVDVVLRFTPRSAPYVLTKPIHPSQRVLRRLPDHSVEIALTLVPNYELEREIIGHADACEVLSPAGLRETIARRLRFASLVYEQAEAKP